VVKHKKGTTQWDFHEIAAEIANEIDILSMFGDDFVLSTVIMPEDLDKYMEIFQSRNLKYRFFLLRPEIRPLRHAASRGFATGALRQNTDKILREAGFNDRVNVIDNTNMT
jgi:hypothetical protein